MSGLPALSLPVGEDPRVDELVLLRSFALAHERYQGELDRVVAARLGDGSVDDQELLPLERERNMLFQLWRTKFGRPELDHSPDRVRRLGTL